MQRYDEVYESFSLLGAPGKISKWHWHQRLLWFEQVATMRNIILVLALIFLVIYQVVPVAKWAFLTIDKHYYGFMNQNSLARI